MNQYKSLTTKLLLGIALAGICGLDSNGMPQNASQPAAGLTAEHAFKNIQVLKDIPSGQLIPAMQFITASLGVECGFCHVENHFDQDDKKPKVIARKMMLMMTAINQNNFDGHREVTCNTCHRGARVPVGIPAISEALTATNTGSGEQQLSPSFPGTGELINRYITAVGGEKALEKIATRVETGNASFAGLNVPIEIYYKAPARRISFMHLPNGDNVTGFDGQQGWTITPGHMPREMPTSEIEGAKIDADLQFPMHLLTMFPGLRPAQPENVTGRETYQLEAEENGQPQIRLYFDQQTGLLLRMLRYSDSPLGLNPVRIDFSDYRTVDGVQVPYRWTVARPSGHFNIQVTEVKQNVQIDDSKFTRATPATPAESMP